MVVTTFSVAKKKKFKVLDLSRQPKDTRFNTWPRTSRHVDDLLRGEEVSSLLAETNSAQST